MSPSISPIIVINGHNIILNSQPLEQYWDSSNPKPRMFPLHYAMSAPVYDSSWLLEERKLYITGFYGSYFSQKPAHTLNTVFPGNNGKVFASWFTGELSLSYGKDIGPFMVDFTNYEHNVTCEFENGVLVSGLTIVDVISVPALR